MIIQLRSIKQQAQLTIGSLQENYYFPLKEKFDFPKILIDKPIFLIGLQGGGLTITRRILARSTNTVSVTSNTKKFFGGDEMQNAYHLNLAEEFRLFHCKYFNEPPFYRGGWMYGTDLYISHFRKDECDFTPHLSDNFKTAIKKIIIRNALSYEGVRFIDKSQSYGLKIPLLNKILENEKPKFLAVVRNPYTAVLKHIHKPAISLQTNLSTEQKIELACQHYRNTFEEIIKRSAQYENVLLKKFEDFLENPITWIEEVCLWCELPFSPKILPQPDDKLKDKWYPINPSRNENIIANASPKHIEIISSRLNDLVDFFGYSRK